MSKATPATPRRAPVQHGSKQGTTPAHHTPHIPARRVSNQDLIARIWDTLEWRKTLQVAFITAIVGITAALFLAGLEVAAHTLTSQAAAWPVGITITATVSYRAALAALTSTAARPRARRAAAARHVHPGPGPADAHDPALIEHHHQARTLP